MVKKIIPGEEEMHIEEAASILSSARCVAAFTGAGISVESGIPDFRSEGGLWTVFSPDEYATINVFIQDPEKAWKLYRALGETIEGKKPNPAHEALAELAKLGFLKGVVTQNVDGLHQAAGSQNVLEIHGDHQHLQCIKCQMLEAVTDEHIRSSVTPTCKECGYPLKPNVVLFGEEVRLMEEIYDMLSECDLLLVIGTSAQVYPAAGLPAMVKKNNGHIFEFNVEETSLAMGHTMESAQTDFFFKGKAGKTVPMLVSALINWIQDKKNP